MWEDVFWDQAKRQSLAEALRGLIEESPSVNSLVKELEEGHTASGDKRVFPSVSGFRRMSRAEPVHASSLTTIVWSIERRLSILPVADETRAVFRSLHAEISQRAKDADLLGPASTPSHVGTPVAPPILDVIPLDPQDCQDAREFFFSASDGQAIHFDVYRHDDEPGKIVKSFLTITAPQSPGEPCTFVNVVRLDNYPDPRVTRGIVVATEKTIHMIGNINAGSAMVFISFERNDKPRNRYEALAITFGSSDKLLACRVVFKRTNVTSADQSGIGTYACGDLSEETRPFKRQLQNFIPFSVSGELSCEDRKIELSEVTGLTHDRLSVPDPAQPGRVRPFFTDGQGREFNPSNETHYAFDTALTLFDG